VGVSNSTSPQFCEQKLSSAVKGELDSTSEDRSRGSWSPLRRKVVHKGSRLQT